MKLLSRIEEIAKSGTRIPKPETSNPYVVRWGQCRGEEALVYEIPVLKEGNRPSTKRIKKSDFLAAHQVLISEGEFTSEWFKGNLPICAKDGHCNFTTIGGIFILLDLAEYAGRGKYTKL